MHFRVRLWLQVHWRAVVVALLGVVIPFLWMLRIDEARWNAITTIWGAFVVGGVVWWVFERQSEAVQRRARLRRNARYVLPTVQTMLGCASEALTATLGLSDEVRRDLEGGATRRTRLAALRHAEQRETDILLRRTPEATAHIEASRRRMRLLVEELDTQREIIQRFNAEHEGLLGGIPDLQGAIQSYGSSCRLLMQAVTAPAPYAPHHLDAVFQTLLRSCARSARELCVACWGVLEESGWDEYARQLRRHGYDL